jgi:hypothetical protein
MIRRYLTLLLMGAFLATSLALAEDPVEGKKGDPEEPPLRLKKKKRTDEPPRVEPKKSDKDEPKDPEKEGGEKLKKREKKDGEGPLVPEDGPAGPEEDEKEVLDRIGQNMRAVEEKLANKELGDPTRQRQEDILKDLDSLINRIERGDPPPQGGGGGGGADQQPQGGGGQAKAGRQQGGGQAKGSAGQGKGNRNGRQNQRVSRQRRQGGTERARGGQQPQPELKAGTGLAGNTGGAGKESPPGARDPNADLYKDIWGHLPESLRAEMNAYSNPQPFLPRYDDLVKKYYRTIAEQGRRKGD